MPTRDEIEEIHEMIPSGTCEANQTDVRSRRPDSGRGPALNPTHVHGADPKVRVLSMVVRLAGIEPAAFRSGAERSVR